jgi:hypothetical protein
MITPDRPFRDRFKLGTHKVTGKITRQSEENAFLAMKTYLNQGHKGSSPESNSRSKNNLRTMTLYNPKPKADLISKESRSGMSSSNITPLSKIQSRKDFLHK